MRVLDPQSQEKDNAIFAAMTIDRAIEGQARNSGKPYDHAYEWGAFKTLKAQIKTYYSREGFK
ncbi:MAG: hypothetical protein LBU73_02935 [Helicobacteraceae bacterium]|nr:hypothetical protein [Helicobacteraceae bacterium]